MLSSVVRSVLVCVGLRLSVAHFDGRQVAILVSIFRERGYKRALLDPLTYYEALTSSLLAAVFTLDIIIGYYVSTVRRSASALSCARRVQHGELAVACGVDVEQLVLDSSNSSSHVDLWHVGSSLRTEAGACLLDVVAHAFTNAADGVSHD